MRIAYVKTVNIPNYKTHRWIKKGTHKNSEIPFNEQNFSTKK
ncbi:hypothetical protein J25TS5_30820 [Paenibacillus faecis]|nr:hypothetical protein J25TS5_30820 [Paenibacillus faecis]